MLQPFLCPIRKCYFRGTPLVTQVRDIMGPSNKKVKVALRELTMLALLPGLRIQQGS
jgi:hypothetical protein